MPFTFTFTDKQLSLVEEALAGMMERSSFGPFTYYDVAELQDQIEKRLEW